ncbi:FCD domain-containing protein [Candidatus Villigracilis saccharophilus]|uniref:FadR/GntR family transcriptional regulator n=1 Tax=Candidatus Villigracilis saccharophilus TaxID=3140684 RepID=UPI0031361F02|nr:FadR family transcriptional regulator [Anaerolineales bacterium]
MTILRERTSPEISEFLRYLASHEEAEGSLPSLNDLSRELGISLAGLREQLEVARALGLVEVKPRTGIRRKPYSFTPAVLNSLDYAIALNKDHFIAFADLRQHIETAYWHEAVKLLTSEDHEKLKALVKRAWEKLRGTPIEIPHSEHRELHLTIYHRLNNPFVAGLLQSYWNAYETVGLNFFTDYNYLTEVWNYHQQMVDAICTNDVEAGYKALSEHTDLIHQLISSSQ